MLTIYGVPLSVHTRKIIVTAILKKMDYRIERRHQARCAAFARTGSFQPGRMKWQV